ncbi:Crp/Fnr family transcriptional regulator [Anaeromicropila populeti]|uniref:CRP/FNR family transcriptional regulator, anaerobic regulatory protein n=1 Tax=Anaeromicropila populeti TaxID=37658 RepID=A0A1I6HI18_9FIRM|nr:Crp/Fnr family transcriptional regulator [Anaeromicropila populeti]SFR54123.1 CRP/FNR family transcriptional regulator, anaerobic regulatory protein [Anaeromicropila populeti]
MITQNEVDILSQSLDFWENLSKDQQDFLISHATIYHYEKGSSLHSGSNDCIGLLVVKSGTIRTYILSEEGREITLYRLERNDICVLSASCVLETITFDVHVDAETDCDIIQINSHSFQKISSENVYAELFSYKLATERFSDVMWAMQQILFTSFDKRLAAFLLDETVKNNSDTIHMTHEQIARYVGSAREVVSRMLKYFVREELVTLSRGGIEIINKQKLRSIIS